MSITIKDLAKLANVSHTTVSRALNDSPLIHPDTKKRIQDLAREHQYIPNIHARRLVTDRAYQIGLFFTTLRQGTTSSFIHEVLKGVHSVIGGTYNLVIKGLDQEDALMHVNRKHFDGVILTSQSVKDQWFIDELLTREIPVVVLNRKLDDDKTDQKVLANIVSDDRGGAYHAVQACIERGHRKIAMIRGKEGFRSTEERFIGYCEALKHHQISQIDDYVVQGNYTMQSGYNGMKTLLRLKATLLPTAVFCSNDEMAVGAMKAAQEAGIEIPGDISILGFDDTEYAKYLTPALTSVKRPLELIGQRGAEVLMEYLKTEQRGTMFEFIPTELIVRPSLISIGSR